ncbi:MAG TPA: ATP-binding protein [Spirochaetia bacterium]|nr:ATP-binding protein [Spirochaetia bacterium]
MTAEPAAHARDQADGIVQIALSPEEDFRDIIRRLENVRIPPTRVSAGSIRFAVLELINNSIRAHREKGEGRDIEVVFIIADGRLSVSVRDFGGGFDPRSLPYDVAADPDAVDLRSAAFEEYQRNSGYKRFGMGLYVARKTFDTFQIMFLDGNGKPRQWEHGSVAGTVINLTARVDARETAR